MNTAFKTTAALAALILGAQLFTSSALAGVGKISSPQVDKGAKEIELTGKYEIEEHGEDEYEWENELELEYGLTEKILLELEAEVKKEHGEDTEYEKTAIGIRYELSEPGEWLVDTAVEAGYAFSGTGDADKAKLELLLKKYLGDIEVLSNIELAREVGEDAENGVELEAALGGYYDFSEFLNVGVEYFADFGNLSDGNGYSEQKHAIGPIIGSEIHLPGALREIEFKLGYYQGISKAAADGTIKYEIELEF